MVTMRGFQLLSRLRPPPRPLLCQPGLGHAFSTTSAQARRHVKICIVGSGPAGFYTAQQILKGSSDVSGNVNDVTVDVYDKLPVPFGLVRYGVAPDHPEVKNVISTFTQTARNPRCNFYGNVNVGRDVTLDELRRAYDGVVLTYGASEDRKLGIPGENLRNVLSARRFVGWYNGLPDDRDLDVDLKSTDTAVVIGQGNVAVDVARILLSPVDVLRKTDITDYALDKLAKSRIRNVHLVGRRGPLQVAFTIKEFRELTKLKDTATLLNSQYLQNIDQFLKQAPRPRKRLTELLLKTASQKTMDSVSRKLMVDFLRSPVEILPSENDNSVTGVKFAVNELRGDLGSDQTAVQTEDSETIQSGLVLTSIGYKSRTIADDQNSLPFDTIKGVVLNTEGRVVDCPGLYCAGWVKNGPLGVIVTTMNDAFNVGKIVLEDLENGDLLSHSGTENKPGFEKVKNILQDKNVRVVTWSDWEKIDQVEMKNARNEECPRGKLTTIEDFLEVLE